MPHGPAEVVYPRIITLETEKAPGAIRIGGFLYFASWPHMNLLNLQNLPYLLFFAEWQEGVQKADQSFRMIAEYLLEREVCLRVQVLHNLSILK